MTALAFLVRRPRNAWSTLLLSLLAVGVLFALLPKTASDASPQAGLPDSSQAAQVSALLERFPGAESTAGLLVWTRDGAELTDADRAAVATRAADLAELSSVPQAVRPVFSDDGKAALVAVPLEAAPVEDDVDAAATQLRDAASADLPDGLTARLTGPVGFQADIRNAFAGADLRLLLVTVAVVAFLLIVTYRSPVLWIVPLVVVGMADGLSRFVVTGLADAFDIPVDASISGILSVLVFGAGTNYALLLVARYREELRTTADRYAAMTTAVRSAGPAIIASGSTVTLSLLTLLLAELAGNRALGLACAVGIVLAMAFALIVLPAALAVCGRGIFWPFVPRPGAVASRRSVWSRVGEGVARRPVVVAIVSVLGIAVLALGLAGYRVGLSQTDQLIGSPESVTAEQVLEDSFPASGAPFVVLLAPAASADDAVVVAQATSGVESATPGRARSAGPASMSCSTPRRRASRPSTRSRACAGRSPTPGRRSPAPSSAGAMRPHSTLGRARSTTCCSSRR
ncbi:hypothetical protein GCM10025866_08090 [Naasia aerilata]|uniref:SSD domain-containing protein n=1 Tax=Naasia aerilata TaxID=1162966 RepID=A0ABM8G9R7_9MICO|nr:hypothetical protein GCM10025866_08090 [Naasia aerilata]